MKSGRSGEKVEKLVVVTHYMYNRDELCTNISTHQGYSKPYYTK